MERRSGVLVRGDLQGCWYQNCRRHWPESSEFQTEYRFDLPLPVTVCPMEECAGYCIGFRSLVHFRGHCGDSGVGIRGRSADWSVDWGSCHY